MVQLDAPSFQLGLYWKPKFGMGGYIRRANAHSVVAFQSGGLGKFSYSTPGYSRNGCWKPHRTPTKATAPGAIRAALDKRIPNPEDSAVPLLYWCCPAGRSAGAESTIPCHLVRKPFRRVIDVQVETGSIHVGAALAEPPGDDGTLLYEFVAVADAPANGRK